MAIILNDNIRINAGKPVNAKYLSSGNTAYVSVAAVNAAISIPERHIGLTVLINTGSSNTEYWYYAGVADIDLIEKKYASEQIVGDFITGATNLGFFSGFTGVQRLALSAFPSGYDGFYYSQYNNYYIDSSDIVRIGTPVYNGAQRRGYYNPLQNKSWVFYQDTSAWTLMDGNVAESVGDLVVPVSYAGVGYTNTQWTGFTTNGSNSVTPTGSLTTGTTLTIGNPIYRNKTNQDLHLRTIINDTPDTMGITFDDNFIHFSGVSSVLTGQNVGIGNEVFKQRTGTTLQFRTLVGSGDTNITQVGDTLVFFSTSSGGSGVELTGATNIGFTGGTGIFDNKNNKTLEFRNIVGSGSTSVSLSGSTVIIQSQGGNTLNVADFTTTGYTATTESDFIGASGGTTIFLPASPKDGQRIVVSDIAGNALSNSICICSTVPSQHIVGGSTATINTEYGSITFIFNSKCFWSTAAFIN
jgi:hypothetical protein